MASPPSSLAAVLQMPGVDPGSHGDGVVNDDESSAAVLSYLHETYPNNEADLSLSLKPLRNFEHNSPSYNRRSASPPDPTIRVDPALQALADATAASTPLDIPAPFTSYPPMLDNYGALGEMGGKRKKLPHERAGWREMDKEGPRKRGRKRGNERGEGMERAEGMEHGGGNGNGSGGDYGGFIQTGTSSASPGIQGGEASGGEQQKTEDNLNGQPPPPPVPESKESRSEQNRRAQQAFRRRREERMKDLEAAAAALEPTQRRLQDAESKLREASLALEASRIESSALRRALTNLALSSGHSVLTEEGLLVIDTSVPRSSKQNTEAGIEHAIELLGKQSRELAKQNRDRRG